MTLRAGTLFSGIGASGTIGDGGIDNSEEGIGSMSTASLVSQLRALARAEHSDLSLGDEAADKIEGPEARASARNRSR